MGKNKPWFFLVISRRRRQRNIGLGLSKKNIKKQKKNLVDLLGVVTQLEYFKDRFAHAKPIERPKGWNLPMGSIHPKNHGNGFMLLGDAAGLIDPFTGEGIGNAKGISEACYNYRKQSHWRKDLTQNNLSEYDKNLWDEIGPQLRVSTKLQKIAKIEIPVKFCH
ncbi:MAG: hypothetical protein CM1200mP10_14180 [Candidatus Neomarinimicrobiota bacterium]|nr:MAG: hypothetical protein CM1200mP10_14180 [Candidatus Neomarinimicrobiota bacterium]